MRIATLSLSALCLSAALISPAMANEALAKKSACLTCHQVEKPILGPALKDIAAKYRGQKGMDAKLAEKVLKGGGGVWKMPMGPMPAQGQVSAADAKQLATWILSLK